MASMCKQFGCQPYVRRVVEAIDQKRVERGISQKDFSDMVGYSETLWGRICLGVAYPAPAHLSDFAAFFGLTIWRMPDGLVLHRDGVKR